VRVCVCVKRKRSFSFVDGGGWKEGRSVLKRRGLLLGGKGKVQSVRGAPRGGFER